MKFEMRLRPCYNLIDLTPLVDVIFLMLIFFLITSDTLPLKSLRVQHPKITTDDSAKLSQLIVIMDQDQVIYVGPKKEIADLNSLSQLLSNYISIWRQSHGGATPTVVLSIDRRIEYQIFLELFSRVVATTPNVRLAFKHDQDGRDDEELLADEEAT